MPIATVSIKSPEEIEQMREAGRLAASVLNMIEPHVQAGVTTDELDALCHRYIVDEIKCIPAPLNYRGFPKSICTSVNNVVCHGIPGKKRLKKGDICNIDVTVIHNGFHGDTSRMFHVGEVSIQAMRLSRVAYESMMRGIEQVKPGATLGDVGYAVQRHAQRNGYTVVEDYCGHGIGREFHEEPQVLNFGQPGMGMRIEAGMTFTVEPMVNAGKKGTRVMGDQWTVVTKDGSLSAQWEHTLAVTQGGCEILTLSPAELHN